jgi:hypothetical protein
MFFSWLTMVLSMVGVSRAFVKWPGLFRLFGSSGGSGTLALNVLCIDRPIEKDINTPVPKSANDLPRVSKKFHFRRVGNGTDDRNLYHSTEEELTQQRIRENMYKLSLLRQLNDDNLNIHQKLALYKLYESEYVSSTYEPNLLSGNLFKDWEEWR